MDEELRLNLSKRLGKSLGAGPPASPMSPHAASPPTVTTASTIRPGSPVPAVSPGSPKVLRSATVFPASMNGRMGAADLSAAVQTPAQFPATGTSAFIPIPSIANGEPDAAASPKTCTEPLPLSRPPPNRAPPPLPFVKQPSLPSNLISPSSVPTLKYRGGAGSAIVFGLPKSSSNPSLSRTSDGDHPSGHEGPQSDSMFSPGRTRGVTLPSGPIAQSLEAMLAKQLKEPINERVPPGVNLDGGKNEEETNGKGSGSGIRSLTKRISIPVILPKLLNPLTGLETEKKPRKYKGEVVTDTFTGKQLVNFLLEKGIVTCDQEALLVGTLLLEHKHILPIGIHTDFKGKKNEIWRFKDRRAGPAVALVALPKEKEDKKKLKKERKKEREEQRLKEREQDVRKKEEELEQRLKEKETKMREKELKKKREKKIEKGETKRKLFGTTVEEVMLLQREEHPELEIPIIIKHLSETLVNLGGAQTEGIFRIPGNAEEVQSLKEQCDNLNYDITTKDPHVVAGCLKLWFRSLREPLIPMEFYDNCIKHARHLEECIKIMTNIPPSNRAVAKFLASFLHKMAETEAVTKMGVENLAMVFAPAFLRSQDPQTMLLNTYNEGEFVQNIIDGWAQL